MFTKMFVILYFVHSDLLFCRRSMDADHVLRRKNGNFVVICDTFTIRSGVVSDRSQRLGHKRQLGCWYDRTGWAPNY